MTFDPDALIGALPRRSIRPLRSEVIFKSTRRPTPDGSALGLPSSYNGSSNRERDRTAELSKWLAKVGSTERPCECDICSAPADDEHAENYYDLASWIGLCQRCHRASLHGRFARSARWSALLDECQLPKGHWARLVSQEPFDLAKLLRSRGQREPSKADFALSSTAQG